MPKIRRNSELTESRRSMLKWLDQEADITEHGVVIGTNGTTVPEMVLRTEPFCKYQKTLRVIMRSVFPREYLATHTLTGNACKLSVFVISILV